MERIDECVDERLKSWCIHCGALGVWSSKDHVPSKTILQRPLPEYPPEVRVCSDCNKGFSADEEYLSLFLRSVIVGSTNPSDHTEPKIRRGLIRQEALRNRIERSKIEQMTIEGGSEILWMPELERVNRVVLKNARGHAFFECAEMRLWEPEYVWSAPLIKMTEEARTEYIHGQPGIQLEGCSKIGSRDNERFLTGKDLRDGWIIVQDGIYQYRVQNKATIVKSILFEYLATEVRWNPDDE